jgi:putative membrane protein
VKHLYGADGSFDCVLPDSDPEVAGVSRRTWLAAERTWLAWWRSGVAVGAVALAVGRLLPDITHGVRWPFRVLGAGYGLLSVAILVVGAVRQRRVADALRRGSFDQLSSPLVDWLTAAAIALSFSALLIVVVAL